ncbi:helix-turn-helix domain-containing protein, partial [Streptomyces hainanensis]
MGGLLGGDPSLLRRINSAVVLKALRDAQPSCSLTDLARVTGLSRPTVEGVLDGLAQAGLVTETDAPEPGGARRLGRPARRFRFRAESGRVLGVEVGPRRVSAVLGDLLGRRLARAGSDGALTANILASMSHLALQQRQPEQAARLARAGRSEV